MEHYLSKLGIALQKATRLEPGDYWEWSGQKRIQRKRPYVD